MRLRRLGPTLALGLVLAALAPAGVQARPMAGEDDTATFSCTSVTYSFTGFPNANGNTVSEFVSLNGVVVNAATFTFDGPSGSNSLRVLVPPGHHAMDARAHWDSDGVKGGRDRKLGGGIRCPADPAFAIEKLQRIVGVSEPFTTSPLSAEVGQTIAYEVVLANTGNVALKPAAFADPKCDAGTIAGGPGEALVAPGGTTSYLCEHRLTSADQHAGAYPNTVSVSTRSPESGDPGATKTSNTVVVKLPPEPPPPAEPAPPPEPPPRVPPLTPPPTQSPAPAKRAPQPDSNVLGLSSSLAPVPPVPLASLSARAQAFTGPEGCVRHNFRARVSAVGASSAAFSLDGHRLGTLPASKAHNGWLSIRVGVAGLRLGVHHLVAKIAMSGAASSERARVVRRTITFLRCDPALVIPGFTG